MVSESDAWLLKPDNVSLSEEHEGVDGHVVCARPPHPSFFFSKLILIRGSVTHTTLQGIMEYCSYHLILG